MEKGKKKKCSDKRYFVMDETMTKPAFFGTFPGKDEAVAALEADTSGKYREGAYLIEED